jgi:hypothetical protein
MACICHKACSLTLWACPLRGWVLGAARTTHFTATWPGYPENTLYAVWKAGDTLLFRSRQKSRNSMYNAGRVGECQGTAGSKIVRKHN